MKGSRAKNTFFTIPFIFVSFLLESGRTLSAVFSKLPEFFSINDRIDEIIHFITLKSPSHHMLHYNIFCKEIH